MKVALVILHARPAKGGAEVYTCDLAVALAGRGHEVSVLAASFEPTLDARVRRVPLAFDGATRLGRYKSFLRSLDDHLAAHAYDVVHAMLPVRRCDLYHPHAGLAAEAIASGHRKHRSAAGQGLSRLANRLNGKRQAFAKVERSMLQAAAPPTVLCLSNYIKQAVRSHYDLPETKLAKLVNAVDLDRFDPRAAKEFGCLVRSQQGVRPDQVVALMVAQDFARKGLAEAVAAWKAVADPRLVLMVVGKDDPTPYVRLAADARFPANLKFPGPTADIRPFYAAADFFVLPTRHDPCSLVVLEALAMGVPVVSTRFNGACEVMTRGVHGYVLDDPADVGSLTRAVTDLLDGKRRAAMSRACLTLRDSLSYQTHLDRLEALYLAASEPAQ